MLTNCLPQWSCREARLLTWPSGGRGPLAGLSRTLPDYGEAGRLSAPFGHLNVLFRGLRVQSVAHILLSLCFYLVELKEFLICLGENTLTVYDSRSPSTLGLDCLEVFL